MKWFKIFLCIFLVLIVVNALCFKRLKERMIYGGEDIHICSKKKLRNTLKKCKIHKKDIDKTINIIFTTIIDKYGANPFLISSKINTIIDGCIPCRCKNATDILKVIGIQPEGEMEKVLLTTKEDDAPFQTLYECTRCHKKKHTTREIVKRSIDEPANIVNTCLICGNVWDIG